MYQTVSNLKQQASSPKMPPFQPIQDLKDGIRFMLYNPRSIFIWGPILIAFESALLKIIIWNVPYTEIDYTAYMEQVQLIQNGESDYSKVFGSTGPLVYPGGHVLLYRFMNWLTQGTDFIYRGQQFFRYLYLATISLQFLIYYRFQLPGGYVLLASLSKRNHSIYVLRLFNDCFTTFFVVLSVCLLQFVNPNGTPRRQWLTYLSSLTYSFALSIKMNALLFLPGISVAIFYLQNGNLLKCLFCALLALLLQVSVAYPFLSYWKSYLKGAFDFHRKFLYTWTINWHFIDEKTFNSDQFHLLLLVLHAIAILIFLSLLFSNWPHHLLHTCRGRKISPFTNNNGVNRNPTSAALLLIITTNFAGVLFARSLHYQFLSWYHWTLPLLLYCSRLPLPLAGLWYLAHEWCWNSFPPNSSASLLLISLNGSLLISCAVSMYANNNDNSRRYTVSPDTKKAD